MNHPKRTIKVAIQISIGLFHFSFLFAQTHQQKEINNLSLVLAGPATTISIKSEKALKIGDIVPDIVLKHVLNYKHEKIKLSDFKGKLVILDMWSTTCTSCIAAFPKMECLQNRFHDAIQILLVDPHNFKYDSEDEIKKALEKLKKRTNFTPSLPIPIHDSILNVYFPHQTVPHYVWIDKTGKLLAITELSYVTGENISSILNGEKVIMPIKNDWAYDDTQPLSLEENKNDQNNFLFRSLFTGYREGLGVRNGIRTNDNGEIIGMYEINKNMRYLVAMAYPSLANDFSKNRTIVEVKNTPQRFEEKFNPAYVYSYDLTIPPTSASMFNAQKYLQEDLKRYFNLSARKEQRKIKSLIITVTDKIADSYSKSEKNSDTDSSTTKKFIHHYPVAEIIKIMENRFDKPLIDETGISSQNMDIDFPDNFNLSDTHALLFFLKSIGFSIKEEERAINVLVISDN
jgi:thiol-disulfide isomerase/thioredoxin